jgi:glycosyltransferase involved in cell wall biosynthesis
MILIFEPTWTGTTHVPCNSATVQAIALAFPEQEIRLHADPTHLDELRRDGRLMATPGLSLVPIRLSSRWRGRPQIVCWRRMLQEWRIFRAALRAVPRGEPCLLVLISTTATAPFAAAWAGRFSGRAVSVQVSFHGNLNDVLGWRSRNPFARAYDTRSLLEARYPVPVRFLVLEEGIRVELQTLVPATDGRTDVLPHPSNPIEAAAWVTPPARPPTRIGFVGLGTPEKGMDTFLSIATRARATHGACLAFVHVGRMPDGAGPSGFDALEHPPATRQLARQEFMARLGSLHYIMLPFRRGYYDLSASGALLDAVTWLKPVIAMRVPLTERFFAEYGDIGHLCVDEAEMERVVAEVAGRPDFARYDRQVDALRRARAARTPEALAPRYRRMVESGFPGLLGAQRATIGVEAPG